MRAPTPPAGAGLYPPDSVSWRVNREAALLLGGGRALLMQLAHPGVAAGVEEHSDFHQRPLRRLTRTLQLTLKLTFGPREQALAAARTINRTHARVRGSGYRAQDPRLKLWVHATLIDSAWVAHDAFVAPLTRTEREAYYEQSKLVGGLLGIPAELYPAGLSGFEGYVERMLHGGELQVDDRARRLAALVLRPPLRTVPAPAWLPLAAITAGLLPEELREAYRLPWGWCERTAFQLARQLVPWLLPWLPAPLRYLDRTL